MIGRRRDPRASSTHGTADRDDKGSQAGYAGSDDDNDGFHAGRELRSEMLPEGTKGMLTQPTVKSRP